MDNHLAAITNTLGQVTRYYYDADGQCVKRADVSGTVNYIGAHFEMQVETWTATSYYFFGAQRVAMRVTPAVGAGTVRVAWLHGDHPLRYATGTVGLGSASLTTNITGTRVAELRYLPSGEVRWQSGSMPTQKPFGCERTGSTSWQAHPKGLGRLDTTQRAVQHFLNRVQSRQRRIPYKKPT